MIPINERLEQIKEKAKETRAQVEHEASLQAVKAAVRGQAQLLDLLTEQQTELKALRQDVTRWGQARSGNGFPWSLLMLAAGVYALYRFSPAVQGRVNDLLGQADLGVKGNLKRAGQAAEEAVDDLRDGRYPSGAADRVSGELRRAGQKTADGLKDGRDELKSEGIDRLDGHNEPR
ncbi:hypothetical protein [Deinococcus sp. QL22]|uniref:hypothetical protein n=1 Tax=Deinococcus sp. QL22 TaxID=2939437 RepID=UPI00201828C4|nr:hypothetical protein [Deinococcus sp. QL22]UQN09806.1 hypothetical protein M1R55_25410 [Deinococcus sp. QL22]